MKKLLFYTFRRWSKTSKEKAPKQTYIVVDTSSTDEVQARLGSYGVCMTYTFSSIKAVRKFLADDVSKNDRKYHRIFKEL